MPRSGRVGDQLEVVAVSSSQSSFTAPDPRKGEGGSGEVAAFWRELLGDVRDAVVLQDADAQVRWLNDSARELFSELRPELRQELRLRLNGEDTGYAEVAGRRLPGRCATVRGDWRIWTFPLPDGNSAQQIDGFLAEVGGQLTGAWDRARTAALIAELAASGLADHAVVVLPTTRGRWEWWSDGERAGVTHGRSRRVAPTLAPVLVEAMASTGPPNVRVLPQSEVRNLPPGFAGRFASCPRVSVVSLGSVSLDSQGETGPTGVLLLGSLGEQLPFGDGHFRAIMEFSRRASSALAAANRHERQKEATEGLAGPLRPPKLPELRGARLAVWYEPSRGQLSIGGDFYDVHPRADGTALLLLGDVCGNGPEAAALTGRVRHALAALHLVERNGQRLLQRLNEVLIATGSSRFATLVLGSVTPLGNGTLRLTLSAGGHPPPLVLRRTGVVEEVTVPGMLVGVSPHARFADCTIELAAGDVCLLYTDGITEARGCRARSELYGQERLSALLAGCAGLSAEAVIDCVRESVYQWLDGTEHDDIALLAIQSVAD